MVVSHDQYFVSRVAKEVMLVGEGQVKKLESFEKYLEAPILNVNYLICFRVVDEIDVSSQMSLTIVCIGSNDQ